MNTFPPTGPCGSARAAPDGAGAGPPRSTSCAGGAGASDRAGRRSPPRRTCGRGPGQARREGAVRQADRRDGPAGRRGHGRPLRRRTCPGTSPCPRAWSSPRTCRVTTSATCCSSPRARRCGRSTTFRRATLATSAVRRRAQVARMRPDLEVVRVRGRGRDAHRQARRQEAGRHTGLDAMIVATNPAWSGWKRPHPRPPGLHRGRDAARRGRRECSGWSAARATWPDDGAAGAAEPTSGHDGRGHRRAGDAARPAGPLQQPHRRVLRHRAGRAALRRGMVAIRN